MMGNWFANLGDLSPGRPDLLTHLLFISATIIHPCTNPLQGCDKGRCVPSSWPAEYRVAVSETCPIVFSLRVTLTGVRRQYHDRFSNV